MQQTIRFSKMHGLGNDFVVIDAIRQPIALTPTQIQRLGDRHTGIGFDQLLFIEKPQRDDMDFYYRIFNIDGSESGQCGNGARCLVRFAIENDLTQKTHLHLQTQTSIMQAWFHNNEHIQIDMGKPRFAPNEIPLLVAKQSAQYTFDIDNQMVRGNALSMGNPHLVLTVDNINTAPVTVLGKKLITHPLFPEGVNVGFMQIVNRHTIQLRVYERGAGETLACGSGACAAVVAGIMNQQLDRQVQVFLPGGELTIDWADDASNVLMTGPATLVFTGQITI